jgi:hypothetical protein
VFVESFRFRLGRVDQIRLDQQGLGPSWGDRIRFAEDHHGVGDGPDHELRGVVRSIRVVTCNRQLEYPPERGPRGRVWMPVPGNGRLRKVRVADPWEPEASDDDPHQSFDGWVVEMDVEGVP